ncbi:DUF7619 domain-containing protein [Flavobacterium ustbae]|uniref:DUF7619 domain-containing protein n=1 Tax=Flavobacterium ustbae TaxID=2488790 RepID=UPI000F78D0EA|nr:T9SS type A sorting domain-containing protein [Flavobacterium ustbae]
MRKLYIFLFLLAPFFIQAQIVNIPDPVFKRIILYFSSPKDLAGNSIRTIDINNDGEIQESEALQISSLTLNKVNGESPISSLEGISKFPNLKFLECRSNNITSLDLTNSPYLEELDCSSNALTSLKIENLINLKILKCHYNQITLLNISKLSSLKNLFCYGNLIENLDFSSAKDLEFLDCGSNKLTFLNVSNLKELTTLRAYWCGNLTSVNLLGSTNLTEIDFKESALESLNLSGLTKLVNLNCRYNKLTSLDVTGLDSLLSLDCAYNKLSSLNVKNMANLGGLDCSWNKLPSLDLTGLVNLGSLDCRGNLIANLDVKKCKNISVLACGGNKMTILDVSGMNKLTNLSCGGNKELIWLIMKSGSTLSTKGDYTYDFFEFGSNPKLRYICADEGQIYQTKRHMATYGYTNCEINSYCSFTPGGDFNSVTGKVTFDENSNGCDNADRVVPNLKLSIDETYGYNYNSISDASGNYFLPILNGTYKITPVVENPNYFTVSPPSFDVNFQALTGSISQHFCITPNNTHTDLEIVLLPLEAARPGFDVKYKLVIKNKGNTTESGTLKLNFNDAVLDFLSSNSNFSNKTENNIFWNFSGLKPLEKREIIVVFNVNAPTEIPAVNSGDILKFVATVNSQRTDEYNLDNIFQFNHTVVGSFDPNDKTCLEGTVVNPSLIGQYLHYMIRFENTGNYMAQNIVVKDIIDSAKFDISTLTPTSSSHSYVTKISGNIVEFVFEDIQLPFDDANNDGYIAFKIKTKPALAIGSSIANEANIYFDYNFPILTNKAISTFKTLGTEDFIFSDYFTVYPNPANSFLNINSTQNIEIYSSSVYDILGRIHLAISNQKSGAKIDISSLKAGQYILKINSDKGTSSVKFIKS